MRRTDAEVFELLVGARPRNGSIESARADFAARHPVALLRERARAQAQTTPPERSRRRVPLYVSAAAAVVVVSLLVTLVLVLGDSRPPDTVGAEDTPATTSGPSADSDAPSAPSTVPEGGSASPAPVPETTAPGRPEQGPPADPGAANGPQATPEGVPPAVPAPPPPGAAGPGLPRVAPAVGMVPVPPGVSGREPLPHCGQLTGNSADYDATDLAAANCWWAQVDAAATAEVIMTGTDATARPYWMIVRHVGGRRSETFKSYYDAAAAEWVWAVQVCSNLTRSGPWGLDMGPTYCGLDQRL